MGGAYIDISALTLPGILWKIQEKCDEAEEANLTDITEIKIWREKTTGQWHATFHAGK